jgi:ribosomal protein S18 acetylase RimI-like enzyme
MAALSPYLSNYTLGSLNPDSLFIAPYKEGFNNIKFALYTSERKLDLCQRIKHFVLGLALMMIPLVNIIILVALREFSLKLLSNKSKIEKGKALLDNGDQTIKKLLNVVTDFTKDISPSIVNDTFKYLSETFQKISQNVIEIADASHNHLLHWHLSKATNFLAPQAKVKQVWWQFLNLVEEKVSLLYPDQKFRALDLTREKGLLKTPYKKAEVKVSQAQTLTQKELEEIQEIEYESFTHQYPTSHFFDFANQKGGSSLFLAKDAETDQIVGTLLYANGLIYSLSRRANAVAMGIGNVLFKKLAATLEQKNTKPEKLVLQVRPSNAAAIKLYKSFGFKKVGTTIKTYYHFPDEKAHVMYCQLPTFLKHL